MLATANPPNHLCTVDPLTNIGTFNVGAYPLGIAFDGANIWVASGKGSSVTELRASDCANLGTLNVGEGPRAIVFDGANTWGGYRRREGFQDVAVRN
jgi:DNA-binding beta-propeller fold protein YncE